MARAVSVQVHTYSGHTYAQRPLSVQIGSQTYKIAQISAEGRTPEIKWFQAVTECGLIFHLRYHLAEDYWSIREFNN